MVQFILFVAYSTWTKCTGLKIISVKHLTDMVHVSRRKVPDKVLLRIYRLFFEVINRLHSQDYFSKLIDEIFSPKEKVMIAKRIGIVYLLTKGTDQTTIADVLKVSTNTVAKYALAFHKRETQLGRLLERMIAKEKVMGFLEDAFAEIFIQPGIKIGHYKRYWDQKKRQSRRKLLGE